MRVETLFRLFAIVMIPVPLVGWVLTIDKNSVGELMMAVLRSHAIGPTAFMLMSRHTLFPFALVIGCTAVIIALASTFWIGPNPDSATKTAAVFD